MTNRDFISLNRSEYSMDLYVKSINYIKCNTFFSQHVPFKNSYEIMLWTIYIRKLLYFLKLVRTLEIYYNIVLLIYCIVTTYLHWIVTIYYCGSCESGGWACPFISIRITPFILCLCTTDEHSFLRSMFRGEATCRTLHTSS